VWSRWIDSSIPDGLSPEQRVRHRYFVNAMSLVVIVSFVAWFTFLASGSVTQALAGSPVPTFTTIALIWYRRTKKVAWPLRLAMIAGTVSLSASALAQTPAQPTNIAFLSVLPLLAMLLLGHDEARRWAIGILCIGLMLYGAAANGYTLPFRDPSPGTSEGMTFIFLILVVWSFSRAYGQLTSLALTEIEQASRSKNAFLANISHEIRTPMNGVLGLTDALLTERMTPEQHASLRLIQRSGQQLVTLINDLLDATKAEAGKLSVEPHDFDLWRLLGDVRGLFEPLAQKKGVRFAVDYEHSLPRFVHQDSVRLRQVLTNLISNGLKFTDKGHVTLEAVALDGDRIRFSVEDTGIGISKPVAEKLFKPFQQAETSASRRHGGTGLGLALSQQLATLMGGRIELESEPGRGSRFFFTLPCGSASSLQPEFTPLPSVPIFRDEAVLIVDDNLINLTVASKLVEKAGFRPLKASSGVAALEVLAQEPVSLVLMDCHMPELDGFETTRRIRRLAGPVADVPVVALTASTLADELAACRSSGMNEVLIKPVSLEQLKSLLTRLLQLA